MEIMFQALSTFCLSSTYVREIRNKMPAQFDRAVFKLLSKKQNQSNYSDQSQQERTLSVFLATIDSEVDERNEGTLHDAYSKEHASNEYNPEHLCQLTNL